MFRRILILKRKKLKIWVSASPSGNCYGHGMFSTRREAKVTKDMVNYLLWINLNRKNSIWKKLDNKLWQKFNKIEETLTDR